MLYQLTLTIRIEGALWPVPVPFFFESCDEAEEFARQARDSYEAGAKEAQEDGAEPYEEWVGHTIRERPEPSWEEKQAEMAALLAVQLGIGQGNGLDQSQCEEAALAPN